jgi:predicted HTH transcriptional regulator
MPEQQNIEYKSSWHDDYLKWDCCFTNAQGGRIYFGKNDVGKVVGLGSCIMKIINACKSAELSAPVLEEDGGGCIVKLFKDRIQ